MKQSKSSHTFLSILIAIVFPVTVTAQTSELFVVVPFKNLSQQVSDEWIGTGISETVSNDLQKLGMAVVRRDTVANALANTSPAPADTTAVNVSRVVGARWLVTGAYQRSGDSFRITTRLIDVNSGLVQQSGTIDGLWSELFQLQDQITSILAGTIIPVRRDDPDMLNVIDGEDIALAKEDLALNRRRSGFTAVPIDNRVHTVIHRTTDPPQIDGRLDDAVWKTATYITEFVQIAPVAGAPGTEQTEAWLAYDSNNIYFAFYAHYSDTSMMRVNRTDRDRMRGDDNISVLFDPFLDQQRAYQFAVNGYGVQEDSIVNADGSTGRTFSMSSTSQSSSRTSGSRRSSGSTLSSSGAFGIRGDSSWNTLYETDGQVVDDGWIAEMAIPFKSLRYPSRADGEPHRWGFQITRRIRGRSEAQSWSPVSRDVVGQLTQFGILDGMENLSQSRNVEIFPEVTGLGFGSVDRDTGTYNQRDPDGDFGIGFKYGITPNLTADLTYNPDFSQIEADRPQIETNQRFALFYPEQRPFFLEGQEIFQVSTPLNLLNTRTIVDPRIGGKLTGKVGNTTLGVIVADDEAAGYLADRADPRFGSRAKTIVGRARYDLYSESYLGAIMTTRDFGQDYNRVGGIDGRFRLGETHRLSFMAVTSSTQNTTDGTLSGPAVEIDFTRQGRNLGYSASYGSIDPEFRTETGFLPRVDLRQATGTMSYRWWPESTLLTWGPSLTYYRLYNHAGVLQDEQVQGQTSFQFRNNMSVTTTFSHDLERFHEIDFRRRGYGIFGILISSPRIGLIAGYNWGDGILFSDNPFLGHSTTGNFLFVVRPTPRIQTDISGNFSNFVNPTGNVEVFNVQLYRLRTTVQFTSRLTLRHIMEHNTHSVTLGNNLLLTYRINAGTAAFLGYDDRYQRGTRINNTFFPMTTLQRTNRAIFAKVSYLFRL